MSKVGIHRIKRKQAEDMTCKRHYLNIKYTLNTYSINNEYWESGG